MPKPRKRIAVERVDECPQCTTPTRCGRIGDGAKGPRCVGRADGLDSCDCLNWCGDDPWLAKGKASPCVKEGEKQVKNIPGIIPPAAPAPLIQQDEQYRLAVAIVMQAGRASVSMVQRKLVIRYSEAQELIVRMLRDGLVGIEDTPGIPADAARAASGVVAKDAIRRRLAADGMTAAPDFRPGPEVRQHLDAAHGVWEGGTVSPEEAFDAGWRTAAEWAQRDDLLADMSSPRYLHDKAAALRADGVQGLRGPNVNAPPTYPRPPAPPRPAGVGAVQHQTIAPQTPMGPGE